MFRTEASSAIGNGHVMRCLALAEQFICHDWESVFVMHECPRAIADRLTDTGITLHELSAHDSPVAVQTLLGTLAPDAIIIDGYQFDTAYRKAIARYGAPVMTLDDGNLQFKLHTDVVLNSSPLADAGHYRAFAPTADLLLGPGYAPLRREFLELNETPSKPEQTVTRILISFGGSDTLNLTAPTALAIRTAVPDNVILDVVVGSGMTDNKHLEPLVNTPNVELHYNCQQMAALMQQSGLAVTAAGSTLWELAFLGIPTISLVVAENQAMALQAPMNDWFVSIDARAEPDIAIAMAAHACRELMNDPEKRRHCHQQLRNIGVNRHAERICRLMNDKVRENSHRHSTTLT